MRDLTISLGGVGYLVWYKAHVLNKVSTGAYFTDM